MSIADRIALVICLAAFIITGYVASRINERLPHIEDEMAFSWQARTIARGNLTIASPKPNPDSFLVPFIIDYEGRRFGKYPIGWPVVLATGELARSRHLVNPLLTAAAIWLVYRLGKKLFGEPTALLGALLGAISPFVIMNGSSLLSHPWSFLLTLIVVIGWLDLFTSSDPTCTLSLPRSLPMTVAALALGLLALSRPWTAVGVAIPLGLHGLWLLARGSRASRLLIIQFGLISGATASLYFLWQIAVTGDPLLNPYLLWWPYDQIGFGPGIGLNPGGHNLRQALIHTQFSLQAGSSDLYGWPMLSWLFLPIGLIAHRRNMQVWLITGITFSLVFVYALYWTPSWVYGPRYYYEGLAAPLLLTAAGIRWLAGKPGGSERISARLRFAGISAIVSLLVAGNIIFYLPVRIGGMRGLNGVSRSCIERFEASALRLPTPALVFVHRQVSFSEYACLLDLNSPFLDTDIVLAISRDAKIDASVAQAFSGRVVRHYYPDTGILTSVPLESISP